MPLSPLARRAALVLAAALAAALPTGVAGASETTCGGADCPPPPPPPAATQPPAGSCPDADLLPRRTDLARIRAATLCLLNRERSSRGETPLRANPKLGRAAQGYSRQMVKARFFNHVSPTGTTFLQRIQHVGYLAHSAGYALGENIAWAGGRLVRMWMHSAGHRRNILDRRFREVGVGVALGTPGHGHSGATYTTDFGERSR
jgi:uncharacterized protein YkwD